MDNRQAIGYILLACKRLGYKRNEICKLLGEMYFLFDSKTEEEAELQGFEWYSSLEGEVTEVKKKPRPKLKGRKPNPNRIHTKVNTFAGTENLLMENERIIKMLENRKYNS